MDLPGSGWEFKPQTTQEAVNRNLDIMTPGEHGLGQRAELRREAVRRLQESPVPESKSNPMTKAKLKQIPLLGSPPEGMVSSTEQDDEEQLDGYPITKGNTAKKASKLQKGWKNLQLETFDPQLYLSDSNQGAVNPVDDIRKDPTWRESTEEEAITSPPSAPN